MQQNKIAFTKCHFCTPNWEFPPKSWPLQRWAQPWLSDLGFIGCLMGLYSSISLSNTGPQTIQANTPLPLLFFFACSYIFPFVKLESCAELISSISVFVLFKLYFLLAFSFSPHSYEFFIFKLVWIHLSFFLPSLSDPVRQSLWESHLLIISAQSCKVSCALRASVSWCLWVCLNPFPSSYTAQGFLGLSYDRNFSSTLKCLLPRNCQNAS